MAGVTDTAFRRLVLRLSAGRPVRLVSEFISCDNSGFENRDALRAVKFAPEEQPFCVQIFGTRPERLAAGARFAISRGAASVEVNAGCPVPKVTGRGGGAGLLRDLPLLARILRAVKPVCDEAGLPLFLKCRIGWDEASVNILDTLSVAEGEGVRQITVHGRTRAQGYRGFADWEAIRSAASRACVPVVGNGDVRGASDALDKLSRYGVAGLAVGRAAIHNPWIFRQIHEAACGEPVFRPAPGAVLDAVCAYQELMESEGYTSHGLLGKLKQMSARLAKGFAEDSGKSLRAALLHATSVDDFFACFRRFVESNPAAIFAPEELQNLNGTGAEEVEFGRQFK
jgi:nifR3 family TIM-barrel protein